MGRLLFKRFIYGPPFTRCIIGRRSKTFSIKRSSLDGEGPMSIPLQSPIQLQGHRRGRPKHRPFKTTRVDEGMPKTKGKHEGLAYLNKDSREGYKFTNSYYANILAHKGDETLQLVQEFANPTTGFQEFKKSFALSMARMGAYKVLIGKEAEIRRHCHFTNGNNPSVNKH
ncbi:hypothetical protein Cgig2_000443 [Carnegiea gigantea]|uniref:Plant heme peroxidase family profile domain-containing protein n=1 Tax=Carnegiea gigantea TaxID=171969 RepID=A0A9Q1GNN7_9CARY|nr:hypothetical protein Cgig2_000443 [Carnegiea gigantea]